MLLLHSQLGHAARARVLSAFLLLTYMSQDIFPTLAMIPAPPLASHPTLLCEVGPQHLVLLFKEASYKFLANGVPLALPDP